MNTESNIHKEDLETRDIETLSLQENNNLTYERFSKLVKESIDQESNELVEEVRRVLQRISSHPEVLSDQVKKAEDAFEKITGQLNSEVKHSQEEIVALEALPVEDEVNTIESDTSTFLKKVAEVREQLQNINVEDTATDVAEDTSEDLQKIAEIVRPVQYTQEDLHTLAEVVKTNEQIDIKKNIDIKFSETIIPDGKAQEFMKYKEEILKELEEELKGGQKCIQRLTKDEHAALEKCARGQKLTPDEFKTYYTGLQRMITQRIKNPVLGKRLTG